MLHLFNNPMESTDSLVLWVLGGYGFVLFYILLEQIKSNKQVAILQNTVADLKEDVRTFLRTEIDTLKVLISDRQNGRG